MGIAATLFDSIRAFLISSTVPIATGPTTTGDTGLDGTEEGGDQEGDGVLRILTGLTDGDLTTGAGSATTASFSGLLTGPFLGFPTGFSTTFTLVTGPFSLNVFGSISGFFSISILASIFLSLTIAFDSIFDLAPLSENGNIVGASLLLVMPSGVPLILFSTLGVFGSSVRVFSLSEYTSNESSGLAKFPAPNVSGDSSVPGGSTFLYGVPGLRYGVDLIFWGTGYLAIF